MSDKQLKHSGNGLSEKGEQEAFKTLQSASKNSSNVDTVAIGQIGNITNNFISAAKESAVGASSTEDKERILQEAKNAMDSARIDIRQINMRSHKTQRGIATLAAQALLAVAAGAVAGGIWLLSKR